MAKHGKLLWLDLEMTGLDPKKDLVLEAAAIATDWEFNEIDVFQGVVHHDDATLKHKLAGNAVFWDAHPAARDGLLKQNVAGNKPEAVEEDLLKFIDSYFAAGKPVLLAGNSIHMDRRFIAEQWPRLDARLHYRMLDVSAWKVVFEGKFAKKITKPDEHRALDDIRASINELKYYLQYVRTS